ncbi:uncharacterized protein V1516DRAFT_680753 [Lipomyces oligophaga]|uniref:uncharacterized protein n=1 Tax=Lipomyces oligophaga TaxID=45792 RepID=UPI0034CF5A61
MTDSKSETSNRPKKRVKTDEEEESPRSSSMTPSSAQSHNRKEQTDDNSQEPQNGHSITSEVLESQDRGSPPPLPDGPPPPEATLAGDWEAILDPNTAHYYYYNHITEETTWIRPESMGNLTEQKLDLEGKPAATNYASRGFFNRFSGKWQAYKSPDEPDLDVDQDTIPGEIVPFTEFSDEKKSRRQLDAFYDVDSAANQHDGRSLKAERQQQRLSKKQVQEFRKRKQERKERKTRSWLLD